MRVYFDQNVFAFIQKCGELEQVRDMLRERKVKLISSVTLLEEAICAEDPNTYTGRIATITKLCKRSADPPSFLLAAEFLSQVRRWRPDWLKPGPDTQDIDGLLKDWHRRWDELRDQPSETGPRADAYRQRAKEEKAKTTERQRQLRLELEPVREKLSPADWRRFTTENWWKVFGTGTWTLNLLKADRKNDFTDWAVPYLDLRRVTEEGLDALWIERVDPLDAPRHRLMGSVYLLQTISPRKLDEGHYMDASHATHLVDCDVFVTCDKAFFEFLGLLRTDLQCPTPTIRKLESKGSSCLAGIERAIERLPAA